MRPPITVSNRDYDRLSLIKRIRASPDVTKAHGTSVGLGRVSRMAYLDKLWHETPLVRSIHISSRLGCDVYLKLEVRRTLLPV